jgi:hypothetical protein
MKKNLMGFRGMRYHVDVVRREILGGKMKKLRGGWKEF